MEGGFAHPRPGYPGGGQHRLLKIYVHEGGKEMYPRIRSVMLMHEACLVGDGKETSTATRFRFMDASELGILCNVREEPQMRWI